MAWLTMVGGLLSLMHGGNFPLNPPKQVKSFLWALPFTVTYLCSTDHNPITYICAFLCLALCWAGKNTPHGRGFRLEEPMKEGSETEWTEYLIRPFFGGVPSGKKLYAYKVLIMSLAGLAAVSGAVIVFSTISIPLGLLFALGGLFKGINAMIFDKNTEAREFADGVAAYAPLATIGGVFG